MAKINIGELLNNKNIPPNNKPSIIEEMITDNKIKLFEYGIKTSILQSNINLLVELVGIILESLEKESKNDIMKMLIDAEDNKYSDIIYNSMKAQEDMIKKEILGKDNDKKDDV